jgi:hypothetical protein
MHPVTLRVPALPLAEYSPVGAGLLANAVGLQRGYPLTQGVIWSLIVPTLCVGMHPVTLRVPPLLLAEYSPVGAGLLANAVGLQRG